MALKDIEIDAEYLDILDESGRPTGKSKLKDEIHRDGDWHGTIQIWLMNSSGELLLQKRSPLKQSRPNKWDNTCGGHISAGEKAIDTAIRELKEELGIDVREEDFDLLYDVNSEHIEQEGLFINRQHDYIYLVKMDIDIKHIRMQEDEVSEIKFVHFQELENHMRNETMDFDFYPDFYKNEINMLFKLIKERGNG